MHSTVLPLRTPVPAIRLGMPRPSRGQIGRGLLAAAVLVAASTVASTLAYLRLPAPTGPAAVGRGDTLLVDPSRSEPRAPRGAPREIPLVTWYPAAPGTGRPAAYVPRYERVRDGLVASGELNPLVVAALGGVAAHARSDARVADGGPYPVVLLSPGNATNVTFYSSLAEDLASHGYVVVGIDHPYQVTAVELSDGRVAVYEGDSGSGTVAERVAARIDERVADIRYVVGRLVADAAGIPGLSGRLDPGRIAVVGHSNGGLAAAEACARDARVHACINIDGQGMGGPFGVHGSPSAPTRPFLFLTKEREIHPAIAALFETAGGAAVRVVVPAASHGSFADGDRFVPRLVPLDRTPDHVITIERGFVRAFLEHALLGAPATRLGEVSAATDVFVEVYPLGGRPHLPGGG